MQVVFNHKNGRASQMQKRYAVILQKLGKGTFAELAAPLPPAANEPTIEELREEADRRGIGYHHRTGFARLREMLGR